MNTKDIRTSTDPDLAGSFAAMERAAKAAHELAIKTNTGIAVAIDGKTTELSAADLIKLRDQESPNSQHLITVAGLAIPSSSQLSHNCPRPPLPHSGYGSQLAGPDNNSIG